MPFMAYSWDTQSTEEWKHAIGDFQRAFWKLSKLESSQSGREIASHASDLLKLLLDTVEKRKTRLEVPISSIQRDFLTLSTLVRETHPLRVILFSLLHTTDHVLWDWALAEESKSRKETLE